MTRQEWIQTIAIGAATVSPYILELFKHWLSKRDTSKRQKQKPKSSQRSRVEILLTRAANTFNLLGLGLSLYTVFSAIFFSDPVTRWTVGAAAIGTLALVINYSDLRRRMKVT